MIVESHGQLKLCLVNYLLRMSKQGQCKIEMSNNNADGRHFGGHQRLCLFNWVW